MPLSDRHAPEDTVIHRENLDANLQFHSIGRYYPEEYGSQIQASVKKHDLIADIPATLAGIVVDRNDHALSSWANQERLQQYEDEAFYKQLELNKRQLLDLDADLKVHDTMMQIDSDLINARQKAIDGDGKVEEEYAKVFDKYKGVYDDTPALAARFNKSFNDLVRSKTKEGLEEDIKTAYTKVGYIISQNADLVNNDIISGNMDALTGIQNFMKKSAAWLAKLPAAALPQTFSNVFNTFVQSEAQSILNRFKNGDMDADTAMTNLKGLRVLYGKEHSFPLVDDQNNILKDTNGEDRKVTFTIDEKTQAMLEQTLKDVSSGGGGTAGDEKILNLEADFDKKYDWANIEEKGYSTTLLNTDPKQLETWFDEFVNNVMNSGLSASKKQNVISKCYKKHIQAQMMIKASTIAKQAGTDVSNVLSALADDIELKQRTNPINFDWRNYQPTINGKTYDLGFGTITATLQGRYGSLGLLPNLGTDSNEASVYWGDFKDILRKAADNARQGNVSTFLNTHDPVYSASSEIISKYMNDSLVTQKSDGSYTYNISTINTNIIPHIKNLKTSADKAGFKYTIDPKQMDVWVQGINNNITDPRAKYQATLGLIYALEKGDCKGDIYKYALTKARERGAGSSWGSEINKNTNDGMLLAALALHKSSSLEEQVLNAYNDGSFAEKQKIANKDKEGYIAQGTQAIFDELKIPKEHRAMYHNLISTIGAISVTDVAKGNVDLNLFKNNFKNIMQQQYINTDGKLFRSNAIKQALLKDATYLKPFLNKPGGIEKLNNIGMGISDFMRNSHMTNTLQHLTKDYELYPDLETGTFHIRFNGKDIKTKDEKMQGVLDYTEDMHNIDAREIGQITILGGITSVLKDHAEVIYKRDLQHIYALNLQDTDKNRKQYSASVYAAADLFNNPKTKVELLKAQQESLYSNGKKQKIYNTSNTPFQSIMKDLGIEYGHDQYKIIPDLKIKK